MSLEEYTRKRSFAKTPEPGPSRAPASSGSGQRFFVQRHHARRLHYDFRLEMTGVLKSWAVPKGPTLDPSEKRLAMRVEDHPLDYGDFEGVIPAGNYGAGSVMVWDRGTYEAVGEQTAEQQLARGDLKFRLHGEKLRGEFALVLMKGRGKGNEWLLIKKKDAAAQLGWDAEQHAESVLSSRTQEEIARGIAAKTQAGKTQRKGAGKNPNRADQATVRGASLPGVIVAEMPSSIVPMQAASADAPPSADDWVFEVKWDGVRAICFLDRGKVRLQSRKGDWVERQYPELTVLGEYIAAETAVIDGEIAVLDEQGRPSFSLLQPRIMASNARAVANLSRTRPVALFAFDLLYLNGCDLRPVPLVERKRALKSILRPSPLIKYSEHIPGHGREFLDAAREKGLEGIVAKRVQSRYESRRSSQWLKIKITAQQEFVICGYTVGERGYFGSLALALYESDKLVYAGNVGTGFTQEMLENIFLRLQPLGSLRCPFAEQPKTPAPVSWVRPELVCSVRFASWTPEGRLRAPVFLGLRPDASPRDCVREETRGPEEAVAAAFVPRPPLLLVKTANVSLEVEGRRLKFTNLNKVFYPQQGYTKRDVIEYYNAVADLLLPHLADRPLSLKRYPDGIEGEYFFQKDAAASFPSWLRIEPIVAEPGKEPTRFVVADDRASLLYLANLGCIDQNPWMSRVGSLSHPDFILMDLDAQDCPYRLIVEAAQLVRRKLDALELEGYPKTTGGDGMHISVPVEPRYTYEQTRSLAEIIARLVASERPDLFTTPRTVARREKGKVYFDYPQNAEGRTISAPYVLRPYVGAPVATPLEWREVTPSLSPQQFSMRTALDRFARVGDLFQPVLTHHQALEIALEKLETLVGEAHRKQ